MLGLYTGDRAGRWLGGLSPVARESAQARPQEPSALSSCCVKVGEHPDRRLQTQPRGLGSASGTCVPCVQGSAPEVLPHGAGPGTRGQLPWDLVGSCGNGNPSEGRGGRSPSISNAETPLPPPHRGGRNTGEEKWVYALRTTPPGSPRRPVFINTDVCVRHRARTQGERVLKSPPWRLPRMP